MRYFLGVDIGGTFTDCVAVDTTGRVHEAKTPSTHSTTPVEGVMDGLALLAEDLGISVRNLLSSAERLSHGTTIGTNIVVERNGARVGLLATHGHGDSLFMMLGNGRTAGVPIDQVFSIHGQSKPRELVPRQHVHEVMERVTADGTVLAPLQEESAREAVRALFDGTEIDAVSVALLWSFRNPAHEQRLRELVRELYPDMYISLSSETSPRQGEYERTVATVINSYVGPASSRYLRDLDAEVRAAGLKLPPFIMQANGGVVPVEVAQRQPVQTIGSGPAGGVAGTVAIARASNHPNVIATDMGGTSFEVGLVVGGEPIVTNTQVLDQYRFHVAQLDVRSIACGGGSIARVDPRSGTLRVGPESAGSDPGPACYGIGEHATVTDADIVLGLIDPDRFLDGRMQLDRAAAERAVGRVAEQLGLSLEATAAGIVHINNYSAATLIRQRTIEQGLDPRDFVLYAFGGAGPVHAYGYADELGVSEVIIPLGNGASTLSAFGIAASDVVRSFEKDFHMRAPFAADKLAHSGARAGGARRDGRRGLPGGRHSARANGAHALRRAVPPGAHPPPSDGSRG
jgi:N-methylhydantoinase A